jgi:serine/threonine protein kinase
MKKQVENYQILGVIGNPQESRVFLVEDVDTKQKFALKALPMDFFNSEREYKTFGQEFDKIAQLRSPNLIRYYKLIGKYTESFFLTEYLEGMNLKFYVDNQTHPMADLLHVALQILKGVQYLHHFKILHQNLKATNILLNSNLDVKLTDFYFSKLFYRWRKSRGYSSVEAVRYFSPEMVRDKSLDERSDIYMIGVVLFYLFTRVMPIRGTSVQEIMKKHLKMSISEIPSTINPELSPELSTIVMQMLQKKPRKRLASLSELILDLTRMDQRQQKRASI